MLLAVRRAHPGEDVGHVSINSSLAAINIGKRLAVSVFYFVAAGDLLNGPRWRKTTSAWAGHRVQHLNEERMKPLNILLICVLVVGIPAVAYALGMPDRYIQAIFLLMLLIYLVPRVLNK
jgi:hypothetical protein